MSSSLRTSYIRAEEKITIYGSFLLFVMGVTGSLFNILVFLTLRTFRQSSCAFYLTAMSGVNLGYLLSSVLPRVLLALYGTDGTENSLFYCRFRNYLSTVCSILSLTCFCLATMDQYFATCTRSRFHRWCNIKLAQRLVIIFSIVWILHSLPYLFLFNHVRSSISQAISCVMTNTFYIQYRAYCIVIVFMGVLPMSITITFGSMAYHNVQQLAYRTVPIVRRELDKQLTVMVLTHVVLDCFAIIPFTVSYIVQLNTNQINNAVTGTPIHLAYNTAVVVSYLHFSVNMI